MLVDYRIAHEGRLKRVAVGDHLPAFFVDLRVRGEGMRKLAVEISRPLCLQIGQADHRRLRGFM